MQKNLKCRLEQATGMAEAGGQNRRRRRRAALLLAHSDFQTLRHLCTLEKIPHGWQLKTSGEMHAFSLQNHTQISHIFQIVKLIIILKKQLATEN